MDNGTVEDSMKGFTRVGTARDFAEGKGVSVKVAGKRVAVFRANGALHAIQDACPHMGAWLSEGKLDGERVICHWHDWRFDLRTGEGDHGKRSGLCAKVYEVRVEREEVFVKPPADPAPAEEEKWVEWSDDFLRPGGDGAD